MKIYNKITKINFARSISFILSSLYSPAVIYILYLFCPKKEINYGFIDYIQEQFLTLSQIDSDSVIYTVFLLSVIPIIVVSIVSFLYLRDCYLLSKADKKFNKELKLNVLFLIIFVTAYLNFILYEGCKSGIFI